MVATERYKEKAIFYSPLWFAFLTGAAYAFWFFDLAVFGFAFLAVMIGITFALCRDLSSLLIYPFIFTLVLYKTYYSSYALYVYGAAVAVLLAGIVVHIVRFRPLKREKGLPLFAFGALALYLAIALSGLTTEWWSVKLLLAVAGLAFLLGLLTVLFSLGVGSDSRKRALKLGMWAVVFASVLAAAEFITHLLRMESIDVFLEHKILPGETAANQYANLISRALPVYFYLSISKRKGSFLWLIPVVATVALVALTNSRATLLMTGVLCIVFTVICIVKSKQKAGWIITLLLFIGAAVAVMVLKMDTVKKLLSVVIDRKFADYHRFELWEMGWKRFLQYPIFGAGFGDNIGYGIEGKMSASFVPFWYHNTLVQTIATFGAVGAVAFIFYTISAIYTVRSARLRAAYVLGAIVLHIFAISLLDIQFYTPQTLVQIAALILCCRPSDEERTPR